MTKPRPLILISIDGWGIAPPSPGNAITQAKIPNINRYAIAYPATRLLASGDVVGLPHGDDGNSEVGHLNMGAGRIVYQDILRINAAIADGSFLRNAAFLLAAEQAKKNASCVHLLGLIGSGAVHSYLEHLFALLWFLKENGFNQQNVRLHLFTDGRDAPPQEAINQITEIETRLERLQVGKIASISGRYYAMDRDLHWDRTEKAYNCIVLGEGEKAPSAREAIEQAYRNNVTDEFIPPTVILDTNQQPCGIINENDAAIFFNFRSDRARQLTQTFVVPNFESMQIKQYLYGDFHNIGAVTKEGVKTFQRKKTFKNLTFISMTEYEKGLPVTAIAFPTEEVKMTLARVLSEHNLKQLHIAETEKYAHITYFFNGYREAPFSGEDRLEIPSPKVPTYDLQPEMSTPKIAQVVLAKIHEQVYDFILINFAAPDMVGHTGKLEAAIKACEAVDRAIGEIVTAILPIGGACIITADHGNVEEMLDPVTGQIDTNHSENPVPFIVVSNAYENVTNKVLQMGILADVAPTVLAMLEIPKPLDMTGRNLLAQMRLP